MLYTGLVPLPPIFDGTTPAFLGSRVYDEKNDMEIRKDGQFPLSQALDLFKFCGDTRWQACFSSNGFQVRKSPTQNSLKAEVIPSILFMN